MEEATIEELEFENAQLQVDLSLTRFDGCMLMLDKVLSMHNHVLTYGIDRTFLAIYNENNLLSNLCDTKFPACEDVLSDYDLNRRYFEVCMEGLGNAIKNAGLWVIKQLKRLLNWIADMWTRFWNLFKKSGGSSKTKRKVDKLRKCKLVRKIEVRNLSLHNQPNIDSQISELTKLVDTILKGNATPDQLKRYAELNNMLDAMVTAGKAGPKDAQVTKIKIMSDGDKNRYLEYVLTTEQNIDKCVQAVGLAVSHLKQLEAQIERNIQQQANNPDAHKQEKLKKNLKDGDAKIADKWKAQLKDIRKLIAVLSHVMKHIMNNRKIMQDDLNIVYKACNEAADVAVDAAKTTQQYNDRHPDQPVQS